MKRLTLVAGLLLPAAACFVPPEADSDGTSTTDELPQGSSSTNATGGPTGGSISSGGTPETEGSSDSVSGSGGGQEPRGGEMVAIEGSSFTMGCDPGNDASCVDNPEHPHVLTERPTHEVTLSSYSIDLHEVTLAHYQDCVADGDCTPPGENWAECNALGEGHGDHPVDCVTSEQGQAFCQWAGKRLPTEAEWEYAARGDDERIYPWGNESPDCSRANMHFNGTAGCGTVDTYPVGSLPAGDSPFGVHDMCGNVAEFVADYFSDDYYANSPPTDPQGPKSGTARVMRGGGYNFPIDPWIMRASSRTDYDSTVPSPQIGFRCARSDN